MDLGGSTASDTDGMTFAKSPDAVLTAVGDLHSHANLPDSGHVHIAKMCTHRALTTAALCRGHPLDCVDYRALSDMAASGYT